MATITTAEINTAIATALGAAASLVRTEDFDELTEGMADAPTLQVYWEEERSDPSGTADRTAFRGGIRQTDMIFHADVYVNQRANIGEDMGRLYPLKDEIDDILQAQDTKPYFGLAGIKALMQWDARRVIFSYAGVDYIGIRYFIPIKIF